MIRRAWVNGTLFEQGEIAPISVMDRGLAYGDGLFETIRIESGRPVLLPLHLARLKASATVLGITCDTVTLEDAFIDFIAECGDAAAKIILTRGDSDRGYLPDPEAPSSLIFLLYPAMNWPAELACEGVVAAVCQQPLGISPMLAGHKHLNRLEQVLLRQELAGFAGAHEALVSDVDGHVVEGVFSNVFWIQHGIVYTPCLNRAGVRGVMRQFLLQEMSRLGLQLCEGNYTVTDVLAADEVFFCNSLYGIWPARQMAGVECQPGPITRRLQQCWSEMLGT
ncbi:MAG: aminodeoxychorismate lyase [Moraxellaceae bacterium]|nr:aminodeoxychorismate lyase [Moraxellaceae bacterium]